MTSENNDEIETRPLDSDDARAHRIPVREHDPARGALGARGTDGRGEPARHSYRLTLDGVLALAGPSVAVVLDPETLEELDRVPLVRPLDMATRWGDDATTMPTRAL